MRVDDVRHMHTSSITMLRYLLAESKDALYAAFIGTKQRRDIMTNANIMQEAMWHDPADVIESMDEQVSSSWAIAAVNYLSFCHT